MRLSKQFPLPPPVVIKLSGCKRCGGGKGESKFSFMFIRFCRPCFFKLGLRMYNDAVKNGKMTEERERHILWEFLYEPVSS